MKRNNVRFILTILTIVILIAVTVIWTNNYILTLKAAGFNTNNIDILYRGINDNGDEYRVIHTDSIKNKIIVAYLEKNKLGLWSLSSSDTDNSVISKVVSFGWMKNAGIKRYSVSDTLKFETEWHSLYYGENAINTIKFLPGQIPEKVALNIRQAGNQYCIHLISFEDPDVLNKINIQAILKKAGCIKDK